jgi:hypothetical protein
MSATTGAWHAGGCFVAASSRRRRSRRSRAAAPRPASIARLRATGLARDFEVTGESTGLTYDGPAAARLRAPRTDTADPV